MSDGFSPSQRMTAMLTCPYPMHLDMFRLFHGLQGLAAMTRLSAASPPGSFSQTVRRRLIIPIARWRVYAVAAGLCQLVFQLSNAFEQHAEYCLIQCKYR